MTEGVEILAGYDRASVEAHDTKTIEQALSDFEHGFWSQRKADSIVYTMAVSNPS